MSQEAFDAVVAGPALPTFAGQILIDAPPAQATGELLFNGSPVRFAIAG